MNKRSVYHIYAVVILVVALVSVVLIGCMKVQQGNAPATTIGTQSESLTEQTTSSIWTENETSDISTGDTQTAQTPTTATEPSLNIETGVGEGKPNIETKPVEEQPTQPTQGQSTQPTQPTQGQSDSTTQPTQSQSTQTTQPTQQAVSGGNGKPDKLLTYEEFLKLSNEKQQEYFFLFEDPLDYAAWLQQAQKEYQDNQQSIVVTGPIDLSTLPTGN